MNPVIDGLIKNIVLNAGKGAAGALENGADWKSVGIAAGLSALAGLLSALLSHPAAQNKAVLAAVAAVK